VVVADLRDESQVSGGRSARGTLLLALGAGVGVVLAAVGLVGGTAPVALGPDAVARVNGTPIRVEDYERTLAALANDRRDPLDDAARGRILDRLVDEELLVQRGLELGLAHHDARVRRDLVAAVMDAVVTGTEGAAPTPADLRDFYASHRERFVRPGRITLRQVWCRVASPDADEVARTRADAAARRLRGGEAFEAVRAALGDAELAPLPDGPLPAEKLLDYVGPTALATALALAPGAVSDPVRSGTGYHVLQLVAREEAASPPLEAVEAEVAAEMRREAGERALRAYLDELRTRADVRVATPP